MKKFEYLECCFLLGDEELWDTVMAHTPQAAATKAGRIIDRESGEYDPRRSLYIRIRGKGLEAPATFRVYRTYHAELKKPGRGRTPKS